MSAGRTHGIKPNRNLDRASNEYTKADGGKDYTKMTSIIDKGYGPKAVKGSNKMKVTQRKYPDGGNF